MSSSFSDRCNRGGFKMKLKTLKDLEFSMGKDSVVIKSELRAEAVKWLEELKKPDVMAFNPRIWIQHFFNLSSEDLKDG